MPAEAEDPALVFRPNPRQEEFFLAKELYVGYGGARGGGKSWAVRVKALLLALKCPGIRLLLVRRSYGELRENHIRPLCALAAGTAEYRERDKTLCFSNGSVIRFGYCDSERDVLRYQGQEYDCIFLDEATQLTEFQFQTFKGCLRGVNDFPKRIYVTCNPGGVGHAWVKRLFITGEYRTGERREDYRFIPAGVYDNLALMERDPEYVRRLESLPYELRQAWLYGSWDALAGQFFSEWDRDVHVCEPFAVPARWRRYITLDYGMDMLAAYLIAVDERGRAWVTRELYEGRDLGEGHPGLIISQAAERLKELAGDEEIYAWLAPPDLWSGRQETGRSVAQIFAEQGIYLTKTSNDRAAGWLAVRERLRVREGEAGEPEAALRIFRCCSNLIRTLPLLLCDDKRPFDCAGQPHEITHAPDALRGFCVYWVDSAAPEEKARQEKLRDKLGMRRKRGII